MKKKAASKSSVKRAGSVRVGVVGLGTMGGVHAKMFLTGEIPGAELAAVCDVDASMASRYSGVPFYQSCGEMLAAGGVDAVVLATPHYAHTTVGIEVLGAGIHLLVEKPLSVHKADCERLIAAHRDKRVVFAAMFNQRTDPYYIKVRELVRGGEMGQIRRVNWIITNWFRPEAYYGSGGWRATWAGEGGGVLLNQCPHNLDLYQWLFGMPSKVRGFCQFGKYHAIEVEDDVTAYFEYPDGMTGVFITSTGESPGTNRLEITGEQGRLVYEDETLSYLRNEIPTTRYSRSTSHMFGRPDFWKATIPTSGHHGEQHAGILKNFVDAIRGGTPLIAPAPEGIHSVELANAIIYSSLLGRTVEMPLSSRAYEQQLRGLIASSKPRRKKAPRRAITKDFSKSF
jgi:predicted dehydrogenase